MVRGNVRQYRKESDIGANGFNMPKELVHYLTVF